MCVLHFPSSWLSLKCLRYSSNKSPTAHEKLLHFYSYAGWNLCGFLDPTLYPPGAAGLLEPVYWKVQNLNEADFGVVCDEL